MEEQIGKDASDTRAGKAKERQHHDIAQQVQHGEQLEERAGDLRKEDVNASDKVDDDLNHGIAENVLQGRH